MKDAKTPLYAVMLANLSNLLMDVLFVYGFNMGAAGAALATSISQILSCSILFSAMRERCDYTSDTHACGIDAPTRFGAAVHEYEGEHVYVLDAA